MSLVCKRWAAISRTSPIMWKTIRLELGLFNATAAERSESFLRWLLPRATNVTSMSIVGHRLASTAESQVELEPVVSSNVAAALAVIGAALRELTIEWSGGANSCTICDLFFCIWSDTNQFYCH